MSKEEDSKKKPEVKNLPCFWDTASRSRRKLLTLDYDGTLAPFRTERMQAYPYPGIPDALDRISKQGDTTLAIISGRPLAEVVVLLESFEGIIIGSHGVEKRSSAGDIIVRTPERRQREGLVAAQAAAVEMGWQRFIEIKPASVALHTRGLNARDASFLESETGNIWSGFSDRYGLEVRRFNGGVEVRAAGWNKGNALRELLQGMPKVSMCVYIGDDETDEDAFEAIRARGYGIRVGDADTRTAARGFLPDVQAVKEFLEAWSDLELEPYGREKTSWIRDG